MSDTTNHAATIRRIAGLVNGKAGLVGTRPDAIAGIQANLAQIVEHVDALTAERDALLGVVRQFVCDTTHDGRHFGFDAEGRISEVLDRHNVARLFDRTQGTHTMSDTTDHAAAQP